MLLNDLSNNIKKALESDDPNVMIDQDELQDLLVRGVIDYNQAFLIYELFHNKRLKTKEFLTLDNDMYLFFGTVPICFSINIILSLLAFNFFLTQTCMKQDQPSLLF